MPSLNTERWIVIATKAPSDVALDRWEYLPGYNARNVNVAVYSGRLLTAHKRVPEGWHLLAKLPQQKAARR